MTFLVQHIRSGEYGRRPQPLDLAPGQLAVNYNTDSPGLYFRTDNGELIKTGPVHVGIDAPYQINYTERSEGEMWLDTTDAVAPSLKVYTQAGWVVVNVLDGTITSDKIANGAVTAEKITLNNTLIPTVDSQFDLGSSVNKLAVVYSDEVQADEVYATNVYTGDLHLKNDQGDWTMIEAEDCLTLRNNKTGKRFKIVMEAID